ncbi:MAG: hypothetical protein J1F28_08180 [Oscillospiraceae bacterium]|nr:hypothetical protein [Oscillospiraceae bacterium]
MNSQNKRYIMRFADSGDSDGIKNVFESGVFGGDLSVQYLRGERPVDSFFADGDDAKIIVASDTEQNSVIGVGAAVIQRLFLNGQEEKCAYLTGLKIHPEYQGKLPFIARAYGLMREEISDCKCVYTTILDDNKPVISMLEKKRRNMPEYRYLGHYTTYCFHGGKHILPLENDPDGFEEIMRRHFAKQSLVPAKTDHAGFGNKRFYCYRKNGEIIACCFVGDQSEFKQYKMSSYGGVYKLLSRLPTRLLGYPAFPKAGGIIRHGAVSYLYVKDNDRGLCSDFLRSVATDAGFSLLIWGGFENNPLCMAMDKMKTVHYGSRLYQVFWDEPVGINGIIGVEAALL